MSTYSIDRTTDVYSKVKTVMDKYGIPTFIWEPIAVIESNMNPKAHNDNPTTNDDSYGIFQLNLLAHPAWAEYDLYDPTTNAEIAAQLIGWAYADAQKITDDPETQATITYSGRATPYDFSNYTYVSGGIKPFWNSAALAKFQTAYKDMLGDSTPSTLAASASLGSGFIGKISDSWQSMTSHLSGANVSLNFSQTIVRYALIGLVIAILVFAVFRLIPQGASTIIKVDGEISPAESEE